MLIRRAARMAGRVGGDLVGVHVFSDDGLSTDSGDEFSAQRRLVEQLGGRVHDVVAASPAEGLVSFAHAEKATQLVLGASRHSRLQELFAARSPGRVIRTAEGVDVHVIADQDSDDVGAAKPHRQSATQRPSRSPASAAGVGADGGRIALADCDHLAVPRRAGSVDRIAGPAGARVGDRRNGRARRGRRGCGVRFAC